MKRRFLLRRKSPIRSRTQCTRLEYRENCLALYSAAAERTCSGSRLVLRGLGDRSSLVFFSHDKFQETESVGCAGIPMRVNCPGWNEQAVPSLECHRRLTFLLPNA